MNKKETIYNLLATNLYRMGKGYNGSWKWTPAKLKISELEYAQILAEYGMKNKLDSEMSIQLVLNIDYIVILLNGDDYSVKLATALVEKYNERFKTLTLMHLLEYSKYNLYFFINIEPYFNFKEVMYTPKELNSFLYKGEEKFLMYIFANPEYVALLSSNIKEALFHLFNEKIQTWLLTKTKFKDYVHNYDGTFEKWIKWSRTSSKVKNLLLKNLDVSDMDHEDIANLYVELPPNLQKKLFNNVNMFFDHILQLNKKTFDEDEVYHIIDSLPTSYHSLLFDYKPNLINDKFGLDFRAKFKYVSDRLSSDHKNNIELPMRATAVYESDAIADMFRDSDNDRYWVKSWINGDLWESSNEWEYNTDKSSIDSYYWSDINEKNLKAIITRLKKEGIKINYKDKDEVKDAALEDDDILTILRYSADEGMRIGDENQISNDISKAVDGLFGIGKWKFDDKQNIVANVDISDYDDDDIRDAYNDSGGWDVGYIFSRINSEYLSSRDMASLPYYQYGFNGDFDKEAFNGRIANDI